MQLIGGSKKFSVYNSNVFSVITYFTFVDDLQPHVHLAELPEDVLWEKRTSQDYINFSTGNETAPLPAFSTATPKTKIASRVTNEPTLTYPSDLWQSVLPPSSSTCVAGDGPSKDNSWFLFLREGKEKNKRIAEVGGLLLLTAATSQSHMVAVKCLNAAQNTTVQLLSAYFVCEFSLWSLSFLITNINIDDLLGGPKWGACPLGSLAKRGALLTLQLENWWIWNTTKRQQGL